MGLYACLCVRPEQEPTPPPSLRPRQFYPPFPIERRHPLHCTLLSPRQHACVGDIALQANFEKACQEIVSLDVEDQVIRPLRRNPPIKRLGAFLGIEIDPAPLRKTFCTVRDIVGDHTGIVVPIDDWYPHISLGTLNEGGLVRASLKRYGSRFKAEVFQARINQLDRPEYFTQGTSELIAS